MDLTKYLTAIDIEAEKESRLLEIQVHQGYRATLEKYIEDNTILTQEQLWGILSLYSITDLPDAAEAEFDGILITFVPTPDIRLSGIQTAIYITYTPQAEITLTRATIDIAYVPRPVVSLNNQRTGITYVPHAEVSIFRTVPELVYVPVPEIRLIRSQGEITYVPHPFITLSQVAGQIVFHGFVYPSQTTRPSPGSINLGSLRQMMVSSVGSDLVVRFDTGITGWMVFAIPFNAADRRWWYQAVNNNGNIGGPFDPLLGNLWSDPDVITFNGKDYKLYISRNRTQAAGTGNYLLSDTPGITI